MNNNARPQQIDQLAYGPNWTWEHNFDPSFIEPCFPSVLNHTKSWEDVFADSPANVDGIHFIKEIFVNDRHSQKPDPVNPESPKIVEPRQKFQRFRAKKFICDECDRSFTMKQNVQQHFSFSTTIQWSQEKNDARCSKRCPVYKVVDKANDGDLSPTEQERNRRPFKCEHCGMEFGRAGGLRRHDMMVHQQKKHACPYEGCSHPGYKCTKALAAHIRSVHTLDRPFACLFCERTFVRKNDLKVHELTHSTQCEFICAKCNNCELDGSMQLASTTVTRLLSFFSD
ncbi:zinc finger, C2H2 type [Ostertagia ostertagi]